LNWRTLKVPN